MVHPLSRAAWRAWLEEHHASSGGVWLVAFKKRSGQPHLEYSDSVEEALCFGWVDSKPNRLDESRSMRWFAPRRDRSAWSKANRERVERMEAAGLMAPAGLEVVRRARASGRWSALEEVERLEVPDDLDAAFARHAGSREHWETFPPSTKRAILEWILQAKRAETRERRIEETASLAARGERANQWTRR